MVLFKSARWSPFRFYTCTTETNSLRSIQWQIEHLLPPKATQDSWRGPPAASPLYLICTSFTMPHLPGVRQTPLHTPARHRGCFCNAQQQHTHTCAWEAGRAFLVPRQHSSPSPIPTRTAALVFCIPQSQHTAAHTQTWTKSNIHCPAYAISDNILLAQSSFVAGQRSPRSDPSQAISCNSFPESVTAVLSPHPHSGGWITKKAAQGAQCSLGCQLATPVMLQEGGFGLAHQHPHLYVPQLLLLAAQPLPMLSATFL